MIGVPLAIGGDGRRGVMVAEVVVAQPKSPTAADAKKTTGDNETPPTDMKTRPVTTEDDVKAPTSDDYNNNNIHLF